MLFRKGVIAMRITQEADYAIRICTHLAKTETTTGAPQLSEVLSIPPRSTSKILRKLMLSGLVKSTRGINGGFTLALPCDNITLKNIIEAIDGKIAIRHCLSDEYNCSLQHDKSKCRFHCIFEELNEMITECLDKFKLSDLIDQNLSTKELIDYINQKN